MQKQLSSPPPSFYTLKVSERDFLGRYTVLSGCGLGAGLADTGKPVTARWLGAVTNNTNRLPSDLQELNKSNRIIRRTQ